MVNVTLNKIDEVIKSVASLPSEVDVYDFAERLQIVSSVMLNPNLVMRTVGGILDQIVIKVLHLAGLAFLEKSARKFRGADWPGQGEAVASNYELPDLIDEFLMGGL